MTSTSRCVKADFVHLARYLVSSHKLHTENLFYLLLKQIKWKQLKECDMEKAFEHLVFQLTCFCPLLTGNP